MRLARLAQALPNAERYHWRDARVGDVVCDSRQVSENDLFVAIPGVSVDGHSFIDAALDAGASALVVERLTALVEGVPTLVVQDSREAYAHLQAALRHHPSRHMTVIGVTGTDGKTTTVRLITQILRAAGESVGCVDSVSAWIGDSEVPTGFHTTTPDASEIQSYLAQMRDQGVRYSVLEATSHGLAQHRVTGVEFDLAVVTNITHEHLDYHGSLEAYQQAKARLFRMLTSSYRKEGVPKTAVLNLDEDCYRYLHPIPADRQLTYGLSAEADVRGERVRSSARGLSLRIRFPQTPLDVHSPLFGEYNAYNILAAACVAYALDIPLEAIRRGITSMAGVMGRMERIDQGQPFDAIVDFAHTPNALKKALTGARAITEGKLIVVFGCAGLRDRQKRAWMGRIAAELADRIVITAEDPRTESLDDIMEKIAQGCRQVGATEGKTFWRIGDRTKAIEHALRLAEPGDVVIVTGKGHERSMCFGETEYPWSDHEAVRQGLRRLGYD